MKREERRREGMTEERLDRNIRKIFERIKKLKESEDNEKEFSSNREIRLSKEVGENDRVYLGKKWMEGDMDDTVMCIKEDLRAGRIPKFKVPPNPNRDKNVKWLPFKDSEEKDEDEEIKYRYRMYELDEDRWIECYMAVQSLPFISKVRASAYDRRDNYLEIIVRGDSIMDDELYRASKGAISRRVIDMDVTDLVGEDGLGAWRKRVWEEIDRLTKREWVERVIDSYGRNPVVKTDREKDLEDMGSFGGPEKREWIAEDICRLVILLGEEVEYKKLLKDKMNGDVKEYNVGVMNGLMLARGALIDILGRDKTDDDMEWAYYKWYGYHGGRRFVELLKKKVGKDFYHVERSEEGDEE